MKIDIHISFLLLIIFMGGTTSAVSQVTIGEDIAPESFSALQIADTNGGLRLPQLTATQVISLKAQLDALNASERQAAAGLIIFNMSNQEIEYWEGSEWTIVGSTATIENGIIKNAITGVVELGGSLTENTYIHVNDKNMEFTEGKWTINNTVLEIDGQTIKLTPSNLNMLENTLSIDNAENTKLTGKLTVSNSNNIVTIENETIQIQGKIRYDDSKKANKKVLTAGYSGRAYWGDLRQQELTRVTATLKSDGTSILSNGANSIISTTSLKLKPGKWLVFAKITARTTASTRMHLWLKLLKGNKTICNVGGDVDNSGHTTPQFTFFLTVDTETTYDLGVSTSNNPTYIVSNGVYGQPHFYAILIDEPQTGN